MDREICANETDCEFSLGTIDSRKFSARRRRRASRITESPGMCFGMVEVSPKVSYRELLFGSIALQPPCDPVEVKIVNEIMTPWPSSDEWIDIGGEG